MLAVIGGADPYDDNVDIKVGVSTHERRRGERVAEIDECTTLTKSGRGHQSSP